MPGLLKLAKADSHLQGGEPLWVVSTGYTKRHHIGPVFPAEAILSAADYHALKIDAQRLLWSAEPASVDLQVPETLVRTLLMEESNRRTVDLQVPEALLIILHAEESVHEP
jgi:hypothetical protein